jgi:3-isopropylmalate dehydratase small subunit
VLFRSEVTVSTGNRNFPGKQGAGLVYLASPQTAAASAVAGVITTARALTEGKTAARPARPASKTAARPHAAVEEHPDTITGRAWVVDRDSVDTDMIFHNKHLAETDPARMGRHAFGNLPGWEDLPSKARPGDVLVTAANFGCGSSRQQAVTCFKTIGIAALIGRSFGAIYERNAINEAMPVVVWDWKPGQVETGDEIRVELATGKLENLTKKTVYPARPLSGAELAIYRRGGLLRRG